MLTAGCEWDKATARRPLVVSGNRESVIWNDPVGSAEVSAAGVVDAAEYDIIQPLEMRQRLIEQPRIRLVTTNARETAMA